MTAVDWPRVALFLMLVSTVWYLAGLLRESGRCRDGDSRKLNHVTALAGGALLFGWINPNAAHLSAYLGMGVAFVLLCLFCQFKSRPVFRTMFRGYARASDAPHEAFHVWFSWAVSILGLVIIDLVFQDIRVTRTAALVLGVADGLAEPVGVRWGKHQYHVPNITGGKKAKRSYEGSFVVFVSTFVVLWFIGENTNLMWCLCVSLAVMVVEALSPHGLDNLTIPLVVGISMTRW